VFPDVGRFRPDRPPSAYLRTAQFCDEVTPWIGAFRDESGEVSPPVIGVQRELAAEAPDEVTGDFETVTAASSEEELERALRNIEEFLVEECGLELR